MKTISYHPWVHRYALLTAAVAWCLPILAGALVTTTDAGMAFRDWPSSDGHNMFAYPWLHSVGEKFLEHGHRLAGSLIGLLSIGLAFVLFRCESRTWMRILGGVVLCCVVIQGLLGGQRVLLEARGLAFTHGIFASWVFALMGSVALFSSRAWLEADRVTPLRWSSTWKWSAVLTALLVAVQYALGALVRHHGTVLYEHAGFALAVVASAAWCAYSASRSGVAWLKRPAYALLLLVMVQLGLGLATYVVRFGFGNYVAVHGSNLQIGVRTAHVLTGMLVWLTAVIYALRVWRIGALGTAKGQGTAAKGYFEQRPAAGFSGPSGALSLPGGTA